MQTSQSEINTAKEILSQLEPGRLPIDIFTEVCRLTVTPVLEIVCFRKNSQKVEVALLKRPENDPNWSGMYHVPGAVLTPTDDDNGLSGIVERVCKTKLEISDIERQTFVVNEICRVKRGVELAVVFMIETKQDILGAEFHDVNALPNNLIEGHDVFIAEALKVHGQSR